MYLSNPQGATSHLQYEQQPIQKKKKDKYKSHQTLKWAYLDLSFISADEQIYQIRLECIKDGSDRRTTLMVRNIPNKYDQFSLLQEINQQFEGLYNFLYLPIDF